MKKLLAGILVLALSGSAVASVTYGTFSETRGIWDLARSSPFESYWEHNNPAAVGGGGTMTPEEYEQDVLAGKVSSVILTIVLDDLDSDEEATLYIDPATTPEGEWVSLGSLQSLTFSDSLTPLRGEDAYADHKTSTTFDLNPAWLKDVLPVQIWLGGSMADAAEIETSTLSVTVTHTPAPGAILLAGIGVGLVGWLHRRRTL